MIRNIIKNNTRLFFFSTAPLKKVGRELVADLPFVNIPVKPKPKED